MIDIKYLREKPDEVKERIKKREMNLDSIVDEILAVDAEKREQLGKVEAMKAEQNAASKQIPQIKKAGGDASEIMAKMKELAAQIKEGDAVIGNLEEKQKSLLLSLPNLPDNDVCAGGKEKNEPIRYFGEKPVFDFPMKNHVDLCESLGMIDYKRGATEAGVQDWNGLCSTILSMNILKMDLNLFFRRICSAISAVMWQVSSPSLPRRYIGSKILPAMTKSLCCLQQKPHW